MRCTWTMALCTRAPSSASRASGSASRCSTPRPYDAPARGKMERFWRTLREGCLDHLGTMTQLHDVQARLLAFLDAHYHQAPHGGLFGKPPAHVWAGATLRAIDEAELATALTMRVRRRVRKDGKTLCANVAETVDPVAITLEGQLGISHDAEHVGQEVRRCRSARGHGVRGPGGRPLGRSGERYLAGASEAPSVHGCVQAAYRPGGGRCHRVGCGGRRR